MSTLEFSLDLEKKRTFGKIRWHWLLSPIRACDTDEVWSGSAKTEEEARRQASAKAEKVRAKEPEDKKSA